jgi:hypothetical protein
MRVYPTAEKWTSFKRGCAPQQISYVLFTVDAILNAVVPQSREVGVLFKVDVLSKEVVPHSREAMSGLKLTSF